jgi:hypothetical protein
MADPTTPAVDPTPTTPIQQPGVWLAVATILAGLLATKLGVHIDPALVAVILAAVVPVIFGLFHHTATTDAAAIHADAVRAAADKTPANQPTQDIATGLGKVGPQP